MKICITCWTPKEEFQFSKESRTRDGLSRSCQTCAAARQKKIYDADPEKHIQRTGAYKKRNQEKTKRAELRRAYGISLEEYQGMLLNQKGICPICEKHMNRPCVDHDHTTGKVRALLCSGCNTALGGLKDSVKAAFMAASYLQKFST